VSNNLLTIGIMTGNSLDAADVVLTVFDKNGNMKDLAFHSLPFPADLQSDLRKIRAAVMDANGDMEAVSTNNTTFDSVVRRYTELVGQTVKELLHKAKNSPGISREYDLSSIDVIGFHGQTCAHKPPSMTSAKEEAYTIQIGDGQLLADITGITTIYDFRSDDIMQGGEGAPLAPVHNKHIAEKLEPKGDFPITFINAGNTSNIAHITRNAAGELVTSGWDAGPCNHLPDLLVRKERGMQCDRDGAIGSRGYINTELLRILFECAARTPDGKNFLAKAPPKSSDPQWYDAPEILWDKMFPFEDRLRTAEYFSAYLLFHSLGYTEAAIDLPSRFALFGGGWKNPVVFEHFRSLLEGDFERNPILLEHRARFNAIRERLKGKQVVVKPSETYGFDGQAMEARIFADMARCRVIGKPFTIPQVTGGKEAVVCGIVRYPQRNQEKATSNLRTWLAEHPIANPPHDNPQVFDGRWSRAAAGWNNKRLT
jgi:anhydro-N-acetylmuramic acid kinase